MARIPIVLCMVLVLTVLAAPAQALQDGLLPSAGFTLTARFSAETVTDGGNNGVWLTGVSDAAGGDPAFLGLAWSPVNDGWFGSVWGLQLVSNAGLIPSSLRPATGRSGLLAGTQYLSLAVLRPEAGHEYVAVIGYTPATGYVGTEVRDLTSGKLIVRQSQQLQATQAPLYPGHGAGSMVVTQANVPLGIDWLITQPSHDPHIFRPVTALSRQYPAEFHLRLPWPTLTGTLTLLLDDGRMQQPILEVDSPRDLGRYAVTLDNIAPGNYSLITQYTAGGATLDVARTGLTVGQLALSVDNLDVTQVASGSSALTGTLHIQTDGELPMPEVGVRVELIRHHLNMASGIGTGVMTAEAVWSHTVTGQVTADGSPVALNIALPFPADAFADTWQVSVQPIAIPDTLLVNAPGTDVWVGKEQKPFTWQGLFTVDTESQLEIVPGVRTYRASGAIEAGPLDMFVMEVDLSQPGIRLESVAGNRFLGPEERWPRSRVSDMVMREDAVAGVNGSFYFLDTMLPRSMLLRDWQVLRSPGPPENGILGITDDGQAYIGLWEWQGEIGGTKGLRVAVSGINPRTNGRHGVVVYRSPWLQSPGTTAPEVDPLTDRVVELVLSDVVQAGPGLITARVSDIRETKPGIRLTEDMLVVSGRGDGADALRRAFAVGQDVEIAYTLPAAADWPALPRVDTVRTAVSGGVILVKGGHYGGGHVTADTGRHPRAAVGVSYDRKTLYFLIADGRSQRSVGLTYKELADFFLQIGAFEALNLDSGGSSTLSIRPGGVGQARAVNSPSDGGERFVADGIIVLYEGP